MGRGSADRVLSFPAGYLEYLLLRLRSCNIKFFMISLGRKRALPESRKGLQTYKPAVVIYIY